MAASRDVVPRAPGWPRRTTSVTGYSIPVPNNYSTERTVRLWVKVVLPLAMVWVKSSKHLPKHWDIFALFTTVPCGANLNTSILMHFRYPLTNYTFGTKEALYEKDRLVMWQVFMQNFTWQMSSHNSLSQSFSSSSVFTRFQRMRYFLTISGATNSKSMDTPLLPNNTITPKLKSFA